MEKPSNKDARARASLSQPQGSGESRKPGYGSALAGGGAGEMKEGGTAITYQRGQRVAWSW